MLSEASVLKGKRGQQRGYKVLKTTKVLVIDDESLVRRSTQRLLSDEGYQVETAETATAGIASFELFRPHVVVLDLKLPDESGLSVLPKLRKIDPSVQVVMITAYGETEIAVQAMKLGATDFLKKPYDLGELLYAVRSAAKSVEREKQLKVYRKLDQARHAQSQMIGRSDAMVNVKEMIRKVAASDATNVLVTGDSGTGKELIARSIHMQSARRHAPLMDINCSAFQDTLLENELFGHERGAYTGANYLKRGLVELCDGGTLFLDEVAEMSLGNQAKLLRFIENKTFRRVGGNAEISVDIRIIAATNADLERMISERLYRRDLYFRLKVVSIHLPPLRERGEDVLDLATVFLDRFSRQFKKDFRKISDETASCLTRYRWPGNVRELQNLIERIAILEDGPELQLAHLPPAILQTEFLSETALPETAASQRQEEAWLSRFHSELCSQGGRSVMSMRELSDLYISFVLDECGNNRSQAARRLGMSRQGLIDRLRRISEKESSSTSSGIT